MKLWLCVQLFRYTDIGSHKQVLLSIPIFFLYHWYRIRETFPLKHSDTGMPYRWYRIPETLVLSGTPKSQHEAPCPPPEITGEIVPEIVLVMLPQMRDRREARFTPFLFFSQYDLRGWWSRGISHSPRLPLSFIYRENIFLDKIAGENGDYSHPQTASEMIKLSINSSWVL